MWVNKHRQVFRVQRFFLSFSRHIIIAIIMPDFFSFLSLDGRSFVSFLFPGIELRKWEISEKEERKKVKFASLSHVHHKKSVYDSITFLPFPSLLPAEILAPKLRYSSHK